ncbi:hypothetical protein [Streptomyces sp. JJ36]|uniref:hypothetical protein n=1 Tax=Streptomyces sp. JJ36 TaxID=2736645 RepID=UPI001F1C3038|nr:hypothetical protein [Streptomyces sp. JJ36]MCF6524092.1 hypothetical protein [Streptomyces sp. JJ36]
MAVHWHAFAWTGPAWPPDREARDPEAAVPPIQVDMWFRKPARLRAGTFTEPGAALEWLARELAETPPLPTGVPAEAHLRAARGALEREEDAYVAYYTAAGGFLVRALLVCPRPGERCPEYPR